jgi:predicted Zn-dependent protease with MMP-like domain
MRGPAVLAGPLSPLGVPRDRTAREVFDDIVLGLVHRIEDRWADELGLIEFAVEETPLVPDDWAAEPVPLGSLVPGTGGRPTRLVLFRKPIELRCETRSDLAALVLTVLAEELAPVLGRPPEEVDPGYGAEG